MIRRVGILQLTLRCRLIDLDSLRIGMLHVILISAAKKVLGSYIACFTR